MNFNMLVAILAGLRGDWAKKAMKQGPGRLGIWETRMLQDLTVWTSSNEHFKHIRQTIAAGVVPDVRCTILLLEPDPSVVTTVPLP